MSLRDLERADEELRRRADSDESLKRAWRSSDGKTTPWMKAWNKELFPSLVCSRQLNIADKALLRLELIGSQGCDVVLRYNDVEEQIEVTLAFAEHVPGANPGQQESLRWERLAADGFVSHSAELKRLRRGASVEYADPDNSRPLGRLDESWARGLERSLLGKKNNRRPGYGRGKTLLVYGDGLSGDFEYHLERKGLHDILQHLDPLTALNSFERTVVVGWHPGWIAYLTPHFSHSGRAKRDPEPRGS